MLLCDVAETTNDELIAYLDCPALLRSAGDHGAEGEASADPEGPYKETSYRAVHVLAMRWIWAARVDQGLIWTDTFSMRESFSTSKLPDTQSGVW